MYRILVLPRIKGPRSGTIRKKIVIIRNIFTFMLNLSNFIYKYFIYKYLFLVRDEISEKLKFKIQLDRKITILYSRDLEFESRLYQKIRCYSILKFFYNFKFEVTLKRLNFVSYIYNNISNHIKLLFTQKCHNRYKCIN